MAGAARLRVIAGGLEPRVAFATAPDVASPDTRDRWPRPRRFGAPQFVAALMLSLAVHAGIYTWNAFRTVGDETLAEGGSQDLLVVEGVSMILLDSVDSEASQSETLPEAQPFDVTAVAALVETPTSIPETADPVVPVSDQIEPVSDLAPAMVANDTAVTVDEVSDVTAPLADAAAAVEAAVEAAAGAEVLTAPVPDAAVAAAVAESAAPVGATAAVPTDEVAPAMSADLPVRPAASADAPVADDVAAASPATIAARQVDSGAPTPAEAVVAEAIPDRQVAVAEVEPPAPPMPVLRPDPKPTPPAARPARPATPAKPAAKPAPATPQSAASVADQAAKGPKPGVAGAGGASTEERGKASSSNYDSKLRARLRRFVRYPDAARADELSGTGIVTFTINSGGAVTSVSLAASSGHRILDQAMVDAVRRASPFPPIPEGLGHTRTFDVPLRFGLK